ncbi:MAG: sigma-70 family RNA polymerase sigma factor [Acidobacteriaceae bacterium]
MKAGNDNSEPNGAGQPGGDAKPREAPARARHDDSAGRDIGRSAEWDGPDGDDVSGDPGVDDLPDELQDELPEDAVREAVLAEGGETSTSEPEDPEFEPFLAEETQLSPEDRVRQDMGTIALERIPGDRRTSSGGMPPVPAGLAPGLAQMSDAEIMQRAGTGDEICFEFLVAKYRRAMIGFMYRMVHNQAVAEELAQEVFLRVYRARASYRAEARFTTWLYRIATNMAINHARDTKNERASSSVYLDQADEETGTRPDVADLRPLAEQDMLQDERMRRIREHVAALPERQRMAVVMHKYQDMDYKQIAAALKLSESATKSLLFRAYQTLRDRLKEFV